MILEVFCSGPVQTNSVLIGCSKTKQGAIIDAPFGSSPLLLKGIHRHHLNVKMLLLTHSHWDHIAEVSILKESLNIPVYIHSADLSNLRTPGSDGLPLLQEIAGNEADYLIQDGDRIQLGELEIEVLHTPGHSPGAVCYYITQEKILISGDTLFKGSIGNLSFPTSQPQLMRFSLVRLAQLPPNTRVIPGHGGETTIGKEQWIVHAL